MSHNIYIKTLKYKHFDKVSKVEYSQVLLTTFRNREKTVAREHGQTQARFWLGTQDAKVEWMINHNGDWWRRRWTDNGAMLAKFDGCNCSSLCPLFINLQN